MSTATVNLIYQERGRQNLGKRQGQCSNDFLKKVEMSLCIWLEDETRKELTVSCAVVTKVHVIYANNKEGQLLC
jgi:hypothetical protein